MELLFRDDAYLTRCEAEVLRVEPAGEDRPARIRLSHTVFYATSGGQPGDSGTLRLAEGGSLAIAEACKGNHHDDIVHLAPTPDTLPAPGSRVIAEIDWDRRHRLMRMHSALHLLCAAVKGDVTGGQIAPDKGRLDFNLPDGSPDKDALEQALNAMVEADRRITTRWIASDELERQPELVRTMSVKPPIDGGRVRLVGIEGIDLQPCGGTHVRSTGEIGRLTVGKIENKGRQNRRINLRFAEG